MTVIYTTATVRGIECDYAYSDEGRYLVSGGRRWEEVYAPLGSGRTFEEGELIPDPESTPEELLGILLGGEDDNG